MEGKLASEEGGGGHTSLTLNMICYLVIRRPLIRGRVWKPVLFPFVLMPFPFFSFILVYMSVDGGGAACALCSPIYRLRDWRLRSGDDGKLFVSFHSF